MALFLHYKTDVMQWAVWKMDESLDDLLACLPNDRSEVYQQQLLSFISEHRKREWLSVRVLLQAMLQADKQMDSQLNQQINSQLNQQIEYTPQGKPFLADHSAFISISHTKGYVAVMLSPASAVGIDIEQYGQRVHRVYDRFVRPDEQIEPYRGDTTWSMLLHWSAKEAVYKCMEKPDADLRKICLSQFVPQEEGSFRAQEFGSEDRKTFTVGYRIDSDFVLTWTMNECPAAIS